MAEVGSMYHVAPETELVRILECPVCTEVPMPPITGCLGGHTICSNCQNKLKTCPLCKQGFGTTRNFTLETIINSSSFKCKYEKDGCRQRIIGEQYRSHLLKCEFSCYVRNVTCSDATGRRCVNQKIAFPKYLLHLIEDHNIEPKKIGIDGYNEEFSMRSVLFEANSMLITWKILETSAFPDSWFTFQGKYFVRRQRISRGILYIYFVMIGSEIEALHFSVDIALFSHPKACPKVQWTIPIQSFRKEEGDMLQLDEIGMVPLRSLKGIGVKDNDKITWATRYIITCRI